jgi:hypothetical protein
MKGIVFTEFLELVEKNLLQNGFLTLKYLKESLYILA